MSDQYIGEIRMAGFVFPPQGWALCDGQLLPISGNEVLFQLIGTTYGGDGQNSFAVPDLRSRVPIHQGNYAGNTYVLGQNPGNETVTLNANQLGTHSHPLMASIATAHQAGPSGAYPAILATTFFYSADTSGTVVPLAGNSTASSGGNQPHNNLMPYQCVNFIIATEGIYPGQN